MWKKPNPVRNKIFAVADSMRKQGIIPTTLNIRAEVGGSQTTASKYLRQWRELYDVEEDFSPKHMQQKILSLTQTNKELTSELLQKANELAVALENNTQLQNQILELKTQLIESRSTCTTLFAKVDKIEGNLSETFNNAVSMLAQQISAINERAVLKVQEIGHSYDEKSIEARLQVRELQQRLQVAEIKSNSIKDKRQKVFCEESSKVELSDN